MRRCNPNSGKTCKNSDADALDAKFAEMNESFTIGGSHVNIVTVDLFSMPHLNRIPHANGVLFFLLLLTVSCA